MSYLKTSTMRFSVNNNNNNNSDIYIYIRNITEWRVGRGKIPKKSIGKNGRREFRAMSFYYNCFVFAIGIAIRNVRSDDNRNSDGFRKGRINFRKPNGIPWGGGAETRRKPHVNREHARARTLGRSAFRTRCIRSWTARSG